MTRFVILLLATLLWVHPAASQEATSTEDDPFIFGLVLIGPKDDQGWSQAHYEGGLLVEERYPSQMLVYENYNDATANDKPMTEVIDEFVSQGAKLVILSSDAFQEEALVVAAQHPDVMFLHIAGDSVLTGIAPDNLGNLMGQMEWAKFLAGCAAGLTTETGRIGYLGPLINPETRRLATSAYLGARYCYNQYRDDTDAALRFQVEWVGFWFYIPDITRNPTQLMYSMYTSGIDVVITGIDTPEALNVANEFAESGERVFATSYNSEVPCEFYPDVCIGTSFYNWGPSYLEVVEAVDRSEWEPGWEWKRPSSLFGPRQIVGFRIGRGFDLDHNADLERFRSDLNSYNSNPLLPVGFPLWQGPLRFQDGSLLAEDGELVNVLDVWYLPQLVDGMDGDSYPSG